MTWTVVTTVFAWLPLVRILGRPEGYRWSILGLSGEGTEGPYWLFVLLTLYALALLFSAYRGPRALFHPLLILWHAAVSAVVITGAVQGSSGATWQGQGLHWSLPLWLLVVPCVFFAVLAVARTIDDRRVAKLETPVAWTRANSSGSRHRSCCWSSRWRSSG